MNTYYLFDILYIPLLIITTGLFELIINVLIINFSLISKIVLNIALLTSLLTLSVVIYINYFVKPGTGLEGISVSLLYFIITLISYFVFLGIFITWNNKRKQK